MPQTNESSGPLHRLFNRVPRWARLTTLVLVAVLSLAASLRSRSDDTFDVEPIFLHLSAANYDAVERALKKDPSLVHRRDFDGNTPLHFAASCGWREAVDLILSHQPDVNAPNVAGLTPLASAFYARRNQLWTVQKLLASGASPSHKLPDGTNLGQYVASTPGVDPRAFALLVKSARSVATSVASTN